MNLEGHYKVAAKQILPTFRELCAFAYLLLSEFKENSSCGCLTQWPCDAFPSPLVQISWRLSRRLQEPRLEHLRWLYYRCAAVIKSRSSHFDLTVARPIQAGILGREGRAGVTFQLSPRCTAGEDFIPYVLMLVQQEVRQADAAQKKRKVII